MIATAAALWNLPEGQFRLLGQSRHLVEDPPMAALGLRIRSV
jgi:hypothetical protein